MTGAGADPLPIDEALPALKAALAAGSCAVLVAPPGAGKTTRVPLALLDEPWTAGGRLILLSPRRLAARAAAERMAQTLGERVGETIGYRMRMDTCVGARTRIEVVTEGVFTRLIQDQPDLPGVAAVLFDEFHERSLDADLALALALDVQTALRPDLRLLPMSATLDGARVAALLGAAPVIESRGRMFPVEAVHVGRDQTMPVERQMARTILRALREQVGSVLAFLPGTAEIHRTARALNDDRVDEDVDVAPLFGAMDLAAQRAALAPSPAGRRKVVLATSIAETSLTIEGVRIVVDSGLARRPRYEPSTGLTRLVTERASQAAVTQRMGRAGRLEPGLCYRLWDAEQTRALVPFDPPEILQADLAPLVLELAAWGVADPARLRWLDPPPAAAYSEARALLGELDALDDAGRITPHGKGLARFPLHPRLAHMIVASGQPRLAAELAALLGERGLGGSDSDLRQRLAAWSRDRSPRATQARHLAQGWARLAGGGAASAGGGDSPRGGDPLRGGDALRPEAVGAVLALAYPDRIAMARPGQRGAYVLANGRGAALDPADPLADCACLAVAEVAGSADRARILLAAPLDAAGLETRFAAHIVTSEEIRMDGDRVVAVAVTRLGRLVLRERPLAAVPPGRLGEVLLAHVRARGLASLPWTDTHRALRDRVGFLRGLDPGGWPDLGDDALLAGLEVWLGPYLTGLRRLDDLDAATLGQALAALLPPGRQQALDRLAPERFATPAGPTHAIAYDAEGGPAISVRVQELFGLKTHPAIADGRVPLVLHLLSPAHRPVQTTRDLPGFWAGSYAAVKAEMRGRYPKHPWPDDPAAALPTTRTKRRNGG